MKVIRFGIEGLKNSFRVPFFRTYHKTFLAPPKTTIIGMLCNISLKKEKEFFEILNDDKVQISVVIETIEGRGKDLWSYKILEKKNRGKSVIRRDFLFMASYTVYLKTDDITLYNQFLNSLKYPKNIPALGLDDELIVLKDIKEVELREKNVRINSIFLDKNYKYRTFIKDISKRVEMPSLNSYPTKFEAYKKEKRVPKEIIEEQLQVEFFNCEVEFESKVQTFFDEELKNGIIFY